MQTGQGLSVPLGHSRPSIPGRSVTKEIRCRVLWTLSKGMQPNYMLLKRKFNLICYLFGLMCINSVLTIIFCGRYFMSLLYKYGLLRHREVKFMFMLT